MGDDAASQKLKLLVVDDEPIVHQMLRRIVQSSGLPITIAGTACSGTEAIEIARSRQPDICILDIHMPGMTGLELASEIRDTLANPPVIMYLTAYRRFEYAQEAVRLGAVDYLVKPIRRNAVIEALRRAVEQLEARRLDELERERLKEFVKKVLPRAVPEGGPAEQTRRAAVARAVRHFVDKHYAEDISLESASSQLQLSSGYLGSIFKEEYGISFRAYLRSVRVARAKDLMRDQALNLSEIAQRVGYDDISYFSQCFYQETGVRPSEYRGEGKRWPK